MAQEHDVIQQKKQLCTLIDRACTANQRAMTVLRQVYIKQITAMLQSEGMDTEVFTPYGTYEPLNPLAKPIETQDIELLTLLCKHRSSRLSDEEFHQHLAVVPDAIMAILEDRTHTVATPTYVDVATQTDTESMGTMDLTS